MSLTVSKSPPPPESPGDGLEEFRSNRSVSNLPHLPSILLCLLPTLPLLQARSLRTAFHFSPGSSQQPSGTPWFPVPSPTPKPLAPSPAPDVAPPWLASASLR
eukprot:746152-Hanusia_phi.AAC.12